MIRRRSLRYLAKYGRNLKFRDILFFHGTLKRTVLNSSPYTDTVFITISATHLFRIYYSNALFKLSTLLQIYVMLLHVYIYVTEQIFAKFNCYTNNQVYFTDITERTVIVYMYIFICYKIRLIYRKS